MNERIRNTFEMIENFCFQQYSSKVKQKSLHTILPEPNENIGNETFGIFLQYLLDNVIREWISIQWISCGKYRTIQPMIQTKAISKTDLLPLHAYSVNER